MAVDPGLARTQRWMQAFIMAPGSDVQALKSAAAQREIPAAAALQNILPSRTLTEIERVAIYRGMYLARLGEALEVDYPNLLQFLGERRFYRLVARYVDTFPSRSYTLNRLGDSLPKFIRADKTLPRRGFLYDLATLELALTEVFDGEASPALTTEQIAAVPEAAWETARLKPIHAFRLMAFRYPVSAYIGAVAGENALPDLKRKNSWVAAYRRGYGVHRLELTQPAWHLLGKLASGKPVGTAVAEASRRHRIGTEQIFEWFRDWMIEGLFQSVELSGKARR